MAYQAPHPNNSSASPTQLAGSERSKSLRQGQPPQHRTNSSDDNHTYFPPPPSYDIASSSPYISSSASTPGSSCSIPTNAGTGSGTITGPSGQDRSNHFAASVSPPLHTQSYQAYAPPLPPSSYSYLNHPYDGYTPTTSSSDQGGYTQPGYSRGGPRRGSAESGSGAGAGATDGLSNSFAGMAVGRGSSPVGYGNSGPGEGQGQGDAYGVHRATSSQRARQRTHDGSGPYPHPQNNSSSPGPTTGPHASTYSLDSGLNGTHYPQSSLNRHDTSSSGGYGRGYSDDGEIPRRPLSGSGVGGARDRSSRGSLRSLQGMTPYGGYGQESPPPVPPIPAGAVDSMGMPMGGNGFLSNDHNTSGAGYGGIGNGQSPYGQPQSSASSYALSMTGGGGSSQSGSMVGHGGPTSTGRVVRNVSSTSSLSLARQPTTNIGSANARRQGVKKAIDVNKPPFTKDFVDDYRARMKGDPDPEAQFAFAKYMIEAARIVGDDMGKIDPKSGRRYRDSLLSESLKLIKRLAEPSKGNDGYAEAQFFLATMIGTGQLGLQVEHEKSYQLYMQASKQNHPAATYRTAVCNELGAGTRKEPNRAVLFYRKAATLRDTAAMYKLGMILLGGLLAQTKNPREGIQWLRRASQQADEDNPHSLHELAMLHENPAILGGANNPILTMDHNLARELYTQAAQLGYAPSQLKLGTCYEYGTLGCQVDPKRSIAWFSRAAEKGESEAELALSGWFLTGAEGIVKQSDAEAYLWARKAANKGLAKGEYAVAYYTEVGIGVKKDLALAQRWYMRAAAQGNEAAAKRLTELRGNKGGAARRAGPSRRSAKQDEDNCVVM